MGYTKVGPSPIVNFTSEYVKPLVALKTNIVAQGGGGTPSAPVAITGVSEVNLTRAGVNLFDKTAITDNVYLSTTTGLEEANNNYCVSDFILVKKGVSYYIPNSNSIRRWFYDLNKTPKTYINQTAPFVFTPTEDGFIRVTLSKVSGQAINLDTWQINIGSSVLPYEPYNPQSDTFTLSLGQTVYGGYVDWENGKLVVNSAIVDLGTLANWSYDSVNQRFYSWNLTSTIKAPPSNSQTIYMFCSAYAVYALGSLANYGIAVSTTKNIYIKNTDYDNTTINDFIASLSGVKLVYELATPIEISLPTTMPSTINGEQNWFADSGDIELCYTSFLEYHKVASVFVTQNSNVQVQTASGSLVNFTTSLVLPLVALKTYIKAQGGGGAPTTPIAITGWYNVKITQARKNLVVGVLTGQAIGSAGNIFADASFNIAYAPIKKGADYIITSDNGVWAYFTSIPSNGSVAYDNSRTIDVNRKFTAPIDGYVAFRMSNTYETPQLEAGSTATAYEAPVTPTTFTLSLGQTVYGGYVDWGAGKLVITWGSSKISDIAWTRASGAQSPSGYVFRTSSPIAKARERYKPNNILCSIFTTDTSDWFVANIDNYNMMIDDAGRIYIRDDDYDNDVTSFVNTLGDTVLYFELPTPIELSLPTTMPSTIEGVQNWFADSGDIELEYKKIM